jgi:hypothetical protein
VSGVTVATLLLVSRESTVGSRASVGVAVEGKSGPAESREPKRWRDHARKHPALQDHASS